MPPARINLRTAIVFNRRSGIPPLDTEQIPIPVPAAAIPSSLQEGMTLSSDLHTAIASEIYAHDFEKPPAVNIGSTGPRSAFQAGSTMSSQREARSADCATLQNLIPEA
jgi:hypothetical protein